MQSILIRLREDFQLSIITLVGLCSLIGITPYIVFRLLEGNLWIGLIDTFLVISTGFSVLYAWRTGDTIRPGLFLAIIYSAGAVFVSIKLGVNGLFWFYTLILFNFFVVPPLQSAMATSAALTAVCIYGYMPLSDDLLRGDLPDSQPVCLGICLSWSPTTRTAD